MNASEGTDTGPNRRELWQWCLRADAVAQCFIRDVFTMKEDSHKEHADSSFWWLGTVPCRSVKFVGLVVAATAYEKRTVYIVDDGTNSIQCVVQHPVPPKQSTEAMVALASQFPKPDFEVGETVRVIGKVQSWRETRQIYVTDICSCLAREEPEHWIAVDKLHQKYYLERFSIPPLPLRPVPQTPTKLPSPSCTHATPSTISSISTACSSKSTTLGVNDITNSPIRLRHPSQLRSRELTANTFKIYLKNYMDVLSDPSYFPFRDPDSDEFSDHETSINESPTKRLRRLYLTNVNLTPKPKRTVSDENIETPKPLTSTVRKARFAAVQSPKGFTLSYLRRVPDLASMAYAVVKTERKARIKDARKKEKEASQTRRIEAKHVPILPTDPTSQIVKRLYIWALKELRKEGSIIVCESDAPVWQLSVTIPPGIWKFSKSRQNMDRSNMTSSISMTVPTVDDDESGELSDPPVREESYIPLTPSLLLEPVLEAVRNLIMRNNQRRKKGQGTQALGPTAEEVQTYLGRTDARWESVGEYTVLDTLELLKKQDRVYRAGNGTWGLPL